MKASTIGLIISGVIWAILGLLIILGAYLPPAGGWNDANIERPATYIIITGFSDALLIIGCVIAKFEGY